MNNMVVVGYRKTAAESQFLEIAFIAVVSVHHSLL